MVEQEHGAQHHARIWNLTILENDLEVLIGKEIRLYQTSLALKVDAIDFYVIEPNLNRVLYVGDQDAL